MGLRQFTCQGCGAPLALRSAHTPHTCEYCGARLIPDTEVGEQLNVEAHVRFAELAAGRGDLDQALAVIRKALLEVPADSLLHEVEERYATQIRRVENAQASLGEARRVLSDYESKIRLYGNNRGYDPQYDGQTFAPANVPAGVEAGAHALELDPEDRSGEIHFVLGTLLQAGDRFAEGKRYLEAACARNPDRLEYRKALKSRPVGSGPPYRSRRSRGCLKLLLFLAFLLAAPFLVGVVHSLIIHRLP